MKIDEAALLAAYGIEDIYCRHHEGGRNQRLARIQVAIIEAFGKVAPLPRVPPQPAKTPSAQDEAKGKQGEDQAAQKSEAVAAATEAWAAQADDSSPDPRNSSRKAEEGAAPSPSADRTPTIGPMAEQVLDLWSSTSLSHEQIALRVGCGKDSVRAFVSQGRAAGDQRGFARMTIKAEPPAPITPAAYAPKVGQPVLIRRNDEEREPPVAGFAKAVERKPFSKPLDPRPGRLAGVTITSPGSVVALDMDNLIVACPGGDWRVTRPVALILERMRNGETFAHDVLAELGSMGSATFADSRKRWAEELAKRGVEFVSTKGVGCRIRAAGT
jgi:hypothetical protein